MSLVHLVPRSRSCTQQISLLSSAKRRSASSILNVFMAPHTIPPTPFRHSRVATQQTTLTPTRPNHMSRAAHSAGI